MKTSPRGGRRARRWYELADPEPLELELPPPPEPAAPRLLARARPVAEGVPAGFASVEAFERLRRAWLLDE